MDHMMKSLPPESFSWLVWENDWCCRRWLVWLQTWFLLLLILAIPFTNSDYYVDFTSISSLVRFRVVLSPQPTPARLYLMKRCKWAETTDMTKLDQIEICPKAMDLTQSIAKRISSDGGGALIIDYGLNGVVSDSLQVFLF